LLQVSNVSKSFGADPVLRGITFSLGSGSRAGLIGANGSGKSTLLRIICGELPADGGSVRIHPTGSVAYLPQYPADELHLSLRLALLRGAGRLGEQHMRLSELERALPTASGATLERLLAEYATVREEFERLDGYSLDARMDEVVQGLGLQAPDWNAPVSTLSGGNKTKLSLARLLLSASSLLLLDEPTNFLDLPALLWLETFVRRGDRTYLIVSHDRRFLDRTVDTVLEIDATEHRLRQWTGTYSDYAEARLREQQRQLGAYRDQQAEIARIEADIKRTKEQARGVEARTKSGPGADYQRRLAKKVAHKAKARERRLERSLEEHRIEKPRPAWGLHLADLDAGNIADNRTVLEAVDVRVSYGEFRVLAGVDLHLRGQDRVALLGENGSGKTTLLGCLAGMVPYEGSIRLGPSIRAGFLSQESNELPLQSSVLDVFRSRTEMHVDEARTYLHKFLFAGSDVFKLVETLSYGQRSKLALAILILSEANFLVLDEPTSHMDMPALSAIEGAVAEFEGPLLVVSHDRYFLERIGVTRVEVMDAGTLHPVDSLDAYEGQIVLSGAS
jgi:ATPase subunit of ABC transporter with duplicated ATPase domains